MLVAWLVFPAFLFVVGMAAYSVAVLAITLVVQVARLLPRLAKWLIGRFRR